MTTVIGNRSDHFPAIVKKNGTPVSHWLKQLTALKSAKSEQRMAIFRNEPCDNQTPTNTDVMQFRYTGPQCPAKHRPLRN
jgi:hypothetical protein